MNNISIFSKVRMIIILFALVACQTPLNTNPIVAPLPTKVALQTATLPPTITPIPTETIIPTAIIPLCDFAAKPLASSTIVSSTSDAIKTYAKFEPPDGQSYFGFMYRLWGDGLPLADGAAWGDTRPFTERICDSIRFELAGKVPTILKVQSGWRSPDGRLNPFSDVISQINLIHTNLGSNVAIMLEWEGGSGATTKDIASGQFDDYIRQYAQEVKEYGQPLFIRLICGEFNGNWWQWCSPKANPNLTVEDFVGAWRHTVDIFRQEGVTNVAWIWTPVAPTPPSINWGWDSAWQSYYPGDDYIDWVGADLNTWGRPNWLDPVYKFGVDHQKPFFLVEFAIRHENTKLTHKQQVQWLNEMFDYFESHPKIKAISYFNYKIYPDPDPTSAGHVFLYDGKVNYIPNVNDHDQRLIAGGDDVRVLFSNRINNPRYISIIYTTSQ